MMLLLIFRSYKCLTKHCVSDSYSVNVLVSKLIPISKNREMEVKS